MGSDLKQAVEEEGVDTFITGERPHGTYARPEETGTDRPLRRAAITRQKRSA